MTPQAKEDEAEKRLRRVHKETEEAEARLQVSGVPCCYHFDHITWNFVLQTAIYLISPQVMRNEILRIENQSSRGGPGAPHSWGDLN